MAGHKAGTENIRRIIRCFKRYGIKYLTLFAFSTENWSRPHEEVSGLMELLQEVIQNEVHSLQEQGVCIRHLGRLDRLSPELRSVICNAIEMTKDKNDLNLNVAFDYGGRSEITEAVRRIVAKGISPDQITEELFQRHLYLADVPDPDLIIRTGGEMRISNFLLWQSAYSEYYSTAKTWPEFDEDEVENALVAYSQRQRRFGKVRPLNPL